MIKNTQKKIMTYILSVMMLFAMIPTVVNVEAAPTDNTVETVSSAKDIQIWMYDYTYDKNDDADYNDTELPGSSNTYKNNTTGVTYYNVTQGLVRNTLDEDGYIYSNKTGNKLTYFSQSPINNESADYLFLKSTNDRTGYYEYSSFKNAAYYDRTTNKFKVYKDVVTAKNADHFSYHRGNFFPFNEIDYNKEANYDVGYDENGNEISTNTPLYLLKKDSDTELNPNYHFGMKLQTQFSQAENGVYNNQDMIYEFNGDDDLWIYIDNVLVLDVGGIHDAHTGTINFRTGEVKVELGTYIGDGEKSARKHSATTTIKAMFEKANVFPDGTEWNDDLVDNYFDGDTFIDYSSHTLTMFYMERGAGASNLSMKFNLPIIPAGQLQIGKRLGEFTSSNYGDVKFGFKLSVEDNDGILQPVTIANCQQYNPHTGEFNSTEGDGLEWDSTGTIFYLQPDEYAIFNNISKDKKYQVTEVDVKSEEFDSVEIVGTSFVATGNSGSNQGYNATSPEYVVGSRPLIVFENNVNISNKKTLKITKKIANGLDSNDTFTVNVKLEGKDGNLTPYNGEYEIKDEDNQVIRKSTTSNGQITLKANQSAYIYEILSDTQFEVTEDLSDREKYASPSYSINTKLSESNDNTTSNINGSGKIELGYDAEVIVTNSYKLGSLTICKNITNIDEDDLNNGDPIFTFVIENQNAGIKLYKTIRFSDLESKSKSIKIDNLPYGDYKVTETNVIRYQCKKENPKTVEINTTNSASVSFTNELNNKNNFSDTDYVENYFTIEDGTGKISWNKYSSSHINHE